MPQSLRQTVDTIKKVSLNELHNVEFVSSLIKNVGLYPDTRNLYGKDKIYECAIPKQGLWQQPHELAEFLIFLSDMHISSGIEIGTGSGYTAVIMAAYLQRWSDTHSFVTLDALNFDFAKLIQSFKDLPIEFFPASSNQFKQKKFTFDFCFIDGDHTYKSIMLDYACVGRSARICAFHDINDQSCPGASKFWNELKKTAVFKKEFIHDPEHLNYFGIGCIIQ